MLTIPPSSNITFSRKCDIKSIDLGLYVERVAMYPLREVSVSVPALEIAAAKSLITDLDLLSGATPTNLSFFDSADFFLIQGVLQKPLLWDAVHEVSFKALEVRKFTPITSPVLPIIAYPALDGGTFETIYVNYYSQFDNGIVAATPKGGRLKKEVWSVTFHLTPTQALELDLLLASLRGIFNFKWSPTGVAPYEDWACDRWSIDVVSDNLYVFSAQFISPLKSTIVLPPPPPPIDPKIKILLRLDGDIIDRSGSPKTFVDAGSSLVTFANLNPFGGARQSMVTTGSNGIVTTSSDLVIPAYTDFCIEGFVNFTTFGSNFNSYHAPESQYLFDLDRNFTVVYSIYNQQNAWVLGSNQFGANSTVTAVPALNTWHFWQVQRSGAIINFFFDLVVICTMTYGGQIGTIGKMRVSQLVAGTDGGYGVVGNTSNFRMTIGSTRSLVPPTAPF
jgi:hypothetical protein